MSEDQIQEVLPPSKTIHKGQKRITSKQKAFARAFVKNKGNLTQSAMDSYDVKDRNTAQAIGSENLTKPIIREEIARLLSKNNIEMSEILEVHKRNMLQTKHYPTSQKAVSDFYDILGMRNAEKPSSDVKIAFIVHTE